MPVILAILAAAAGIAFYLYRIRMAADTARDLVDMANDVRLAARRFGFRRKSNVHPVESLEEPELAITALAMAFQEVDGLPTQEARDLLNIQLRKHLKMKEEDAEEAMTLGRWLVAQCSGADAAIARLSKRLYKLGGVAQLEPLMAVIQGALVNADGLSQRQSEALQDIKRAFRV